MIGRKRYRLILEAPGGEPDRDAYRRVRMALKRLWRCHRLRCVEVVEQTEQERQRVLAADETVSPF